MMVVIQSCKSEIPAKKYQIQTDNNIKYTNVQQAR